MKKKLIIFWLRLTSQLRPVKTVCTLLYILVITVAFVNRGNFVDSVGRWLYEKPIIPNVFYNRGWFYIGIDWVIMAVIVGAGGWGLYHIIVKWLAMPSKAQEIFCKMMLMEKITAETCPHLTKNKLDRKTGVTIMSFYTPGMPYTKWVANEEAIQDYLDVTFVEPVECEKMLFGKDESRHRVFIHTTPGRPKVNTKPLDDDEV